MLKFIIKRVLKGLICVWFIWTMIFFLVRLTGDPTDWMLPDGATEQEMANLRASLHLDEPLTTQYIDSLLDMFHGDAGNSYYYKRDVVDLYNERLFTTLKLAIPGFAFAITFGILIGTLAAMHHNSPLDRVLMSTAVVGYTVPSFCFGIIMIFIFSLKLDWLPSSGTGTWKNLIMPMLAMSFSPLSNIARLTRSSLQDAFNREYIDGARMKGVKESIVVVRHALRNSLIPVVTGVGMQIGTILGGTVVVETVFTWPGMGMLLVTAAKQRDFPTVQYGILLVAASVTLVNILIDISYGYLDPRIREDFK